MSNEIAQIHTGEVLRAAPHAPGAVLPAGASNVRAWVETYTYAAEFAAAVVDTPFVPDSYRPKVDPRASAEDRAAARDVAIATAATAIVYGAGIGFDNPVQALQNVYVVKGRPALYADAMVAVVQAAGHEIWVEDLTDSRAVVCGRRRGGREERAVFTMDQAKKAGYASRNENYGRDPQAMLYARAAGRLCKRIAQAELKGFVTMEEVLDGDLDEFDEEAPAVRTVTRAALPASTADAEPAAAAEKPKATRTTRPRKTTPPARPTGSGGLPPLPGEEPASAAPAAAGPPRVSEEQLARISAGLAALNIVGVNRRRYVEDVLGHAVDDPQALSVAEADTVIAALEEPPADAEPAEPDAGDADPDSDADEAEGQAALDVDGDDGSGS